MNYFFVEGYFEEHSFDNDKLLSLIELLKNNGILYNNIMFTEHCIFETHHEFNKEGLEYLKNVDLNKELLMLSGGDNQYFSFTRKSNSDWIKIDYIDNAHFASVQNIIMPFLIKQNLSVAYMADYWYNFFQSTNRISAYQTKGLEYQHLKLYFNEEIQLKCIDVSKNPGSHGFLDNMFFIPAFKIWFGNKAQEFLGKEKILKFKNCESKKILNNVVIEMQLFDDIKKSENKKNQKRQLKVKKYFNIPLTDNKMPR